ncbi:MAG TPA: acylphosphatase [Syntrophobacteraceae bacterium]|nr:acylphosphatase [Syntrophobacteraceae bacterium]
MEKRRVRVRISGRVQGVFFRAYTHEATQLIGVTGWVRNLHDGRVEAVLEGDADKVNKMVEWCYEGSPLSRVDEVEVLEEVYSGDFSRFQITR